MATSTLPNTGYQVVAAGDANPIADSVTFNWNLLEGRHNADGSLKALFGGCDKPGTGLRGPGPLLIEAGGTNQNVTLTPSGTGVVVLDALTGVNTTAPGAQLGIVAENDSTIGLLISHPGTTLTDALQVKIGGTNIFRIRNDGSIAVGDTLPNSPFAVAVADEGFIEVETAGGGITESSYIRFQNRALVGYSATAAALNITGEEELTLTGDGRAVGIGTPSGTNIRIRQGADDIQFHANGVLAGLFNTAGQFAIDTSTPETNAKIQVNMDAGEFAWMRSTVAPSSSYTRLMPGLRLSSDGAVVSGSSFVFPSILWMSGDGSLTTENPKLVAFISAEATQSYSADTAGGARIAFGTAPNTPGINSVPPVRMFVDQDGGLVVGSPTGGSQGAGTINATQVFDDGVGLTDYLWDLWADGKMSREDQQRYPDARLWTLEETRAFVTEHRHFPTMPSRNDTPSVGHMVSGLLATIENMQMQIFSLEERLGKHEHGQ